MEIKKSVNLARLNALNDEQLIEKLNKSPSKVLQKKERLTTKIKSLELEIQEYIRYRAEEASAIKKIIEERTKTKGALPKGNLPSQQKVA